jgi:hypothetical protein
MESEQNDDRSGSSHVLERKHKKMLWIAFWANVLSWTVLVFYVVTCILSLVQSFLILRTYASAAYVGSPQMPSFLAVGISILATFFTGVVYVLVLKGVSLGLKMLVETDLNYKLSCKEENHA